MEDLSGFRNLYILFQYVLGLAEILCKCIMFLGEINMDVETISLEYLFGLNKEQRTKLNVFLKEKRQCFS